MSNHLDAIKDFTQAIRIDDTNVIAYFHLGTSKLKAGLIDEAIADFKIAEEKDISMAGILDGLGQCYHALKVYDEALDFYQRALKLDADNVEFLKNRSQTYYDL